MTLPFASAEISAVFDQAPPGTQEGLLRLRELIFDVAESDPDVGPVTETLKWGQPSYLTHKPKSGTTIRLGWSETGDTVSLFVHCQTSLVDTWRAHYGDALTFIGNREIALPTDQPLPRAALQHCIAMALTYHLRKTAS